MENPFTDISEENDYYEAALWGYQNGITVVEAFNPKSALTRWHAVMFLWRAVGCPEPEEMENPFTDISEKNGYYKAALWAYQNGITEVETFNPYGTCKRAQMITFLYRTIVENGYEIVGCKE